MKTYYFFIIILLAAALRILPHPPNIIPITALALFAGAHLNRRIAFFLPLSAMIISDFFLGFHSTIPYVYGSFILITFLGFLLKKKITLPRILTTALGSSMLFFIITNFGVWASTTMYVKNMGGLLNSYLMGLPFFKNSVFGDLFYTLAFFYGYELYLLLGKKLAVYFKR